MQTHANEAVEAGADHPGVPAISFVSNFDRHGAGPSQEPRSPFFISARLPQFEIIFDAISTLDYLAFFQTWQSQKPYRAHLSIYLGTLSVVFYFGVYLNQFLIVIDFIGIPTCISHTASRRSTLGPLFLFNCMLWDSVPNGSLP